jgi:hypothetical protein
MARITSKLNWTSDPDNAPLPSDFNRIENNNDQAFDEIDALDDDIGEENTARLASEAAIVALIGAIGTLDAVGSIAFLSNYSICAPGATETQSYASPYTSGLLSYAGIKYGAEVQPVAVYGLPKPTGTWKCLGYGPGLSAGGPSASLYIKVSD